MGSNSQAATKRWQIAPVVPEEIGQQAPHMHPTLVQILYNRGMGSPAEMQAFLDGYYLQPVDPFLLADMDKAVARISGAIQNNERIVVYGDFDADGVTSTVLLIEALRGLGMDRRNARPYIPDRVDEGYGLNTEALSKIRDEFEAHLVITVDCGIRSVAEVEHANQIGLDMIITDHHSIGPSMPPALAVINPKRLDSEYPEKMLAGVGIAYKLAVALYLEHGRSEDDVQGLLDLVAIGTVADVAPLQGENRQLVRQGLEMINKLQRPGVSALASVASVKAGQITAESIGFSLGPRINAAGRLEHAYDAARLLATDNLLKAQQMANQLNELNRQRQQLTSQLNAHAESLITDIENKKLLIAVDPTFVSGVVGLVAGRLKETYYRPSIVLQAGEHESHGSCRSIPELHITQVLDQVSDLLERYGGHAAAAGLTIRNEHLEEFYKRLEQIVEKELENVDLRPSITIDSEIDLEDVDWALYELLQQLEPTGAANATPIFASRNVEVVHHRVVGRDQSHLQLEVAADETRSIRCIGFGLGHWGGNMPKYIDIAYTLGRNDWKGRRNLQLGIQDIQLPT